MALHNNENIIINFNLDNSSSKTGSKNSKDSKESKSNASLNNSSIDPFPKELLTIKELKKISYEENKENSPNLNKNENLYDLNEKANYLYLLKILENKDIDTQSKITSFNDLMYKLTYEDRKYLLNKYKDLFDKDEALKQFPNVVFRQEKKLKEVFISLLKDIINNKVDKMKELFETKYFVETQLSNIPFLEGTDEYIYANLINDTYDTFISKSKYPSNKKDKAFDENKYLSNIINKKISKPIIKSNNIKVINNNICDMEIEENIVEKNEIKKNVLDYQKYYQKMHLLKPILKKYCSEEFQKKYEEFLVEYPEISQDKKIKYVYEIIIESLFYYCLNFNEKRKNKIISEFGDIFFEYEEKKIECLENPVIDLKVKDMEGNDIDFTKGLKNKNYIIIIKNYQFIINFYDYNIASLFESLDILNGISEKEQKKFIENNLNNHQFWTIQKHAKVNSLYNDKNLKDSFKEEVNAMLNHKVLENLFSEISIFENYKYPFHKKEFLEQVHNSIMYITLPTILILGLTLKKMGVIIINKGRYNDLLNDQKNQNVKYILKLGEFSFYKITLLHEINFHYFLVILFSNKHINFLHTPEIVFKNYKIEGKMDFEDKGEVLLFGVKISVQYIKAISNIITLDLWNKNSNIKPIDIGSKFLKLNTEAEANSNITIGKLIDLSKFTKCLFEIISKEYDM